MQGPAPRKFKFLGCEILYREACRLAAAGGCRVDVEFLRKGLHDLETADMRETIQAAIDTVDSAAGYEAILLGYARCNDGVAGLVARDLPLVIPRAHDCITLFFGSRQAYQDYFDSHPGTYFLTTGWMERNEFGEGGYALPAYGKRGIMAKLGLAQSYEQYVAQYGKENADYILQTIGDWRKHYSAVLYLEMGVCDERPFLAAAQQEAREQNWSFEHRRGDWTLLEKLFGGQWDDDFVIVRPGQTLAACNDGTILGARDSNR